MSLAQDLALFEAKLNAGIQSAMEGPVADTAKAFLSEAVETEVYEKYEPQVYRRKGLHGGLADPENMDARYDAKDMTLEVEDVRRDDNTNRLVAPVVESGRGYDYFSPGARPFHRTAEKNMARSGAFEQALDYGLRRAGFETKTV